MATKKPNIVFRKQLFRISNNLNGSDLSNLKFLCGDTLARRALEDAKTAFDLFSALEGKDELSPHKLDFLEDLLDSVGKRHLVRELREALANPVSYEEEEAPGALPPPSLSSLDARTFNKFLVAIGDELTERDLRNVAYFFQSYNVTGLSAQEVQKLREPGDLFKILKQEKVISPTNLGKLRTVMDAIGRKDLCQQIDEYSQTVPGGSSAGTSLSSESSVSMDMKPGFDSMSDDSSTYSGDGKEVGRYPPRGIGRYPIQGVGPMTGNTDLAASSRNPSLGTAMEEEGKEGREMCIGMHGSIRVGSENQVAMEQSPVGQPQDAAIGQLAGRISGQPLGQLAGHSEGELAGQPMRHPALQPVGQLSGQPMGHPAQLSGQPSVNPVGQPACQSSGHPHMGQLAGHTVDRLQEGRDRTRTQILQLQLNEMVERKRHLESQLEHERVHRHAMTEQREHSNSQLVRELEGKIKEVESLRQETAALRKQLLSGENTEIYPMNTVPPHGKAIVIVNDVFVPNPADMSMEFPQRRGARQDMFLFEETFKTLGYDVDCHSNLTAAEMHRVVSDAAGQNHDAHDSFVCCISTHGDDEAVYGCDSARVKRSELVQYVKQSKSLYRKPKMFFLQACRTKSASRPTGSSLTYQPDAPDQDADIFTANASTANYASYRDQQQGSWFVIAVYRVFTQYFNTLTLDEMMHKVNSLVSDAQGYIQERDPHRPALEARQCAETTSSFRMGLRFKFSS